MRYLLIVLFIAGCTEKYPPSIIVEGQPRPIVGREDDGKTFPRWYEANDLDAIVREYARTNNLDFDFRGTEPQFWIARDRGYLAKATYSSGYYKPVLTAKIGWDGQVIEHTIGLEVHASAAGEEEKRGRDSFLKESRPLFSLLNSPVGAKLCTECDLSL